MQVESSKTVVVLATGGTIAGLSAPSGTRGYVAAQVSVEGLLGSVAAPMGVRVVAEQVAQIDSKDMTHDVWRSLARRCRDHLALDDVAGIVVTHGTDTMEETAVFLERVLAPSDKVVVLTGSMRPADSPDADGPGNLARALALAAMPGARGVVVAISGEVHAARAVRKVHPSRMQAFASADGAALARWGDRGFEWLVPAASWPTLPHGSGAVVDIEPSTWPRVEIVTSHAGSDGRIVDALVAQRGLDGLVVAATGNGTLHHRMETALEHAQRAGVAVRRVTRCPEGVIDDHDARWPSSTMPSAAKARVELLLDLLSARA